MQQGKAAPTAVMNLVNEEPHRDGMCFRIVRLCILSGDSGELFEEDDLPLHKYPPGMRTERRELPFQFGALLSFMVLMTCLMIFMQTKKQEATATAKRVKVT